MLVRVSPRSRQQSAALRWCGVSLKGRPKLCPRALARSRPSPVWARINSRAPNPTLNRHRQIVNCRATDRQSRQQPPGRDERLFAEARDAISMQLLIGDRPAFLLHTIATEAAVGVHHRLITLAVAYVLPRRPRA